MYNRESPANYNRHEYGSTPMDTKLLSLWTEEFTSQATEKTNNRLQRFIIIHLLSPPPAHYSATRLISISLLTPVIHCAHSVVLLVIRFTWMLCAVRWSFAASALASVAMLSSVSADNSSSLLIWSNRIPSRFSVSVTWREKLGGARAFTLSMSAVNSS